LLHICIPLSSRFELINLVDSGFTPHPENIVHDKLQHFLVFFFLTLLFYWIVDTTKRRILNMTIFFSLIVDIGSEILQTLIVPVRSSFFHF